MNEHALDLLHLAVWAVGLLGGLIVILLGAIAALAKWQGEKLFERLAEQDKKMVSFQETVATVGEEIKQLLASETRMLRESHFALAERVGRLETFRDMVQFPQKYGRRRDDVKDE